MASDGTHPILPVILDTDPGVDDAVAILMALACREFNVIGLTTTAGNVPLARATRNALAILEHVGRPDIPICKGAARPMRGRYAYARQVHSASGLTRRLPDPNLAPSQTPAVSFLAQSLLDNPGEITVIALGPLTNLARLLRRRPAALRAAKRVVVMGGAVNVPGNVSAHAEFNFYSDPTAARLVIESGIPLTLIDLGACRQVYLSHDQVPPTSTANPMGKLASEMLNGWFRKDSTRQLFHLYDPLTILAVTHPHVVRLQPVAMTVVDSNTTDDPAFWGTCQVADATKGPISIAARDGVDSGAALAAIDELLQWK
ncbi:MAG: nucleoside hydrolase [Chloroflexi bacterium]|nr:nucleoside hydrolase [Chloroflexota bacterium]MYD47598.1 nucleoside hydrolase [Chloroflexota bacterium]